MKEKIGKAGWSNSTLKLIAIGTMFLDHIGAVLLEPYMIEYEFDNWLFYLDIVLRFIGRIAFPIFIFLLLEGYEHTSNRKRYGIQLLIFAFLSEIPFNLALNGTIFYFGYQNVMFTLLLGYCAICFYESNGQKGIDTWLKKYAGILVCILLGYIGKTDYGAFGVIAIVLLYKIKKEKKGVLKVGAILFLWEITAPIAFLFLSKYNGKRGLRVKYFFYWFYPIHLFLLSLIRIYFLKC